MFGACGFQQFEFVDVQIVYIQKICSKAVWIFLGILGVSRGLPRIIINGSELRDTAEHPEIMEMRVLRFSHKQIEKLPVRNEAE